MPELFEYQFAGEYPVRMMSLFSGFGGFDVGAKSAGCELVAANEYDPPSSPLMAQRIVESLVE